MPEPKAEGMCSDHNIDEPSRTLSYWQLSDLLLRRIGCNEHPGNALGFFSTMLILESCWMAKHQQLVGGAVITGTTKQRFYANAVQWVSALLRAEVEVRC